MIQAFGVIIVKNLLRQRAIVCIYTWIGLEFGGLRVDGGFVFGGGVAWRDLM